MQSISSIAYSKTGFDKRPISVRQLLAKVQTNSIFWSNDDFEKSGICSRSVGQLLESHLPILNGSLKTLAALRAKHKVYVHINNTNPILWGSSPERQLLDEVGIQVAADAMRIEL